MTLETKLSAGLLFCLAAASCRTPSLQVWTKDLEKPRYTAVNLRPRDVFLSSAGDPVVPATLPAGAKARIRSFTAEEVKVEINHLQYSIYPLDERFDDSEEGVQKFIGKFFTEDPELSAPGRLEPEELYTKMKLGDVVRGMTKEQVYVALGPPRYVGETDTPAVNLSRQQILDEDYWTYTHKVAELFPQKVVYSFQAGKLVRKTP